MSELSKDARTVLQAIYDLQFTGRSDPRLAKARMEYRLNDVMYFDPVPVVAIVGEVWPIHFDLDCALRLLETEEAICHSIESNMQIRTYIRPDGRTVNIGFWIEDDIYRYSAMVDDKKVFIENVLMINKPDDRNSILFSSRFFAQHDSTSRARINSYRITKVGREMLGDNTNTIVDEKHVILNQMESDIIQAIGANKRVGTKLAIEAGYDCNSSFKGTLATLVRRELLHTSSKGYTINTEFRNTKQCLLIQSGQQSGQSLD